MAYDDSEALQPNSTYNLGGYSFDLEVQSVHEPGEPDVVSVFAICHSPDGTRETVPMDFPAGTTVENWSVEANETEATVYATVKKGETNPWNIPPFESALVSQVPYVPGGGLSNIFSIPVHAAGPTNSLWFLAAADSMFSYDNMQHTITYASSFTYNGKTVYYTAPATIPSISGLPNYDFFNNYPQNQLAWQMIYGSFVTEPEEDIIARFAIDLREADGGPDGDWDEPGDVGPDPEKHFTLTVSVTGASAGSNSGTPLEAGQAGGYGNGGTGGNGGGGGAGASTVIIYEFATNKADNVVQEATAQGPGTGGPGGKGGKGGDGCILIFY